MARIAPSWIGTSYCLPVRLSVIVSVSAITAEILRRRLVVLFFVHGGGYAGRPLGPVGDAVIALQPAAEVGHLAALAAERPPGHLDRLLPTIGTHRPGGHPDILF